MSKLTKIILVISVILGATVAVLCFAAALNYQEFFSRFMGKAIFVFVFGLFILFFLYPEL